MNPPGIGQTRGVFAIFVPGMFLLSNLVAVIYLCPFVDPQVKAFIVKCASQPVLSLVLGVGFGYLVGLILRLFSSIPADKLSAAWLRKRCARAKRPGGKFAPWAEGNFPYKKWIREMCVLYLPPEALRFYEELWGPCGRDAGDDGLLFKFFNFYRVIIKSLDVAAWNECYAAEALVRYMSGMLYALGVGFMLLVTTFILRWVWLGEPMVTLIVLSILYVAAGFSIVVKFRFIRVKEAETLFAACFVNRKKFEELLGNPPTKYSTVPAAKDRK